MRKQTKRFLAGLLAAACTFSSISVNGLGVAAAEGNAPDTPWQADRYELENGRTFVGEGYTKDITIKTGGQFSGGKAIDTMDKNGNGAGVEIAPEIEGDSLYSIVLGYSKGIAYKEGKIALYKNDERVDYFYTFTSDNKVVTAEPIVVRLSEGDKLSLISDTGDGRDAVACFDYLDVSLWGGRYEAENGEMTSDEMTVRELDIASGKKMAAGFEKADGAGVEFPFVIPQDDTYTVKLGYNRVNYETADQIGLYVNGERAAEIELIGRGNTDEIISWSDDLDIDLKAGDTVAVKRSAAEEDLGLLELDYLEIAPKTVRPIDPETLPKFTSSVVRIVKGDSVTVPVKNVPEGMKLTYSSSDDTVAAVNEKSGKITAQAAGEALITAASGKLSFSCKAQVVDTDAELPVPAVKYEAEDGELIGSHEKFKAVSDSHFSGGKFVDGLYDAGTGAAVKIAPEIEAEGEYMLTMCYAKGSMYPNDRVSVYVNETKVGEFKMQSGSTTDPRFTNTLTAVLKPGDSVKVQKDAGMDSLFRYDYLDIAPVTTIPVRGIVMNQEEMSVIDKESVKIPYTIAPAGATDDLVWSSSNPAVAEADGGIVRGRSVGEAVITAVSRYNEEISASIQVTVTNNEKLETIASDEMEVMLDRNFPRVMEYRMKGSGNSMDGNPMEINTIRINGKNYQPEVTFEKNEAGDTLTYTMKVKELDAVLVLQVKVEGTLLKFDFTDIKESKDEAKRIFTLDIPNMNPVSVSSREEVAEFAGSRMEPNITKSGDDYADLKKEGASAAVNYNYAFLSNGKVAAGVRSNAYTDQTSAAHLVKETVAEGSAYRTSIRSYQWIWRAPDYTKTFKDYEGTYGEKGAMTTQTYKDTPNRNDMPKCYIALAEDLNGTGTVDWQDAAIRFRDIMYIAVGMDIIPDAVVQRLIMPQAGEGNYPFVSSLDETKRVYLNTDGLGQIILNKFHNLGYWGDFSVYDDHLGGLKDFRKFVADSTNIYNGFVGVHTNFTQAFAKTNQFSMESIAVEDGGETPKTAGYKAFGYFLHQSYTTDDTWESLSGERRDAMKLFKEDVPDLGFIYSDVYSIGGWRGQRLIDDYEANDLAYFVEWPYMAEAASVWSHWAVEKSYSPASNKGYSSDIARFIFNHTKDRWDNNAEKCDNERVPSSCNLLMGADTTSYEGWVHDGVNRYDYIIEKVFDNNLPSKYMQHFPILRMDKDANGWGEHIWFEDGLEVFKNEDGKRTMTKDGKLVYTEDAYLLPWDEGDMQVDNSEEEKEVKLYHWNEKGGTTTWNLQDGWTGLENVYVYKLTDQGKTEETIVPVVNGTVTLENIEARTPYVIYKGEAAPAADVAFGDGTIVKDGGFNYGDLREWDLEKGMAEVRKNDLEGDDKRYYGDLRNYELIIDGTEETAVSQTIEGLNPGEEYAASVMVEVEQGKEREASIEVDCGGKTVKNYTTKSLLKQWDAYDSKASTYMLRMRVVFKVPKGETSAVIRLHAAEGEGKVRFDNVRVYDTTTPKAPADAEHVVFYQDFEYGKRENAAAREENKVTYESYYPFNLGAAGGIREARAMLQTRHDPYTQNNANFNWDPKTIWVDMALDGNNSLSIITDSLGAAFQTTPQTIRFEEGHTYRLSFLYQNALDDTFAFVLGKDQDSTPIYQEILKATPAFEGSKTFSYEFTSTSDQTWFSINRVDRTVTVSDNPNPFVIDNILVEDLTLAPNTYKVTVEGCKEEGLDGVYDYNTKLTVTAKAPEEGKVFAGWDVNGNVLSTEESYTFFVGTDLAVKAVYTAEAQKAEAAAYLQDVTVTKRDDGKSDIRYLAQLVLPQGAKLANAGLVWRSTDDRENLVLDGENVKVTKISKISNTYQFTVTIKGVPTGKTVPGRIFAEIADGESVIYSEVGAGTAK